MMNIDRRTSGILGVAFMFQFVTSLSSGVLQRSTLFVPENISNTLLNIANNTLLMRTSLVLDILTSLGVIFLGAVLFVILRIQNEKLALTALGLYILEGALFALSRTEAFKLLSISQQYSIIEQPVHLLTLGKITFESMQFAGQLMMLSFCFGAILFYYLLDKSRIVPRVLSLWGLITVSLLLIWTILALFGYNVPFFLYLPYVPFEFVIGLWFMFKGIKAPEATKL